MEEFSSTKWEHNDRVNGNSISRVVGQVKARRKKRTHTCRRIVSHQTPSAEASMTNHLPKRGV
ncbi:MAG: hypothetical protein ABI434_17425, partial [Burkholderiaceae bacterium]